MMLAKIEDFMIHISIKITDTRDILYNYIDIHLQKT